MFQPAHRLALLMFAALWAWSVRAAGDEPATTPTTAKDPLQLERLSWHDDARQAREAAGRILVEAQDGGLLLLGQDGRLWSIEKEQLVARKGSGDPFRPLTPAALAKQLKSELGNGFDVVTTRHYVICTSARRKYAQWCGSLFERLYTSFHNYWKARGVKLTEPEFPLIAIVLRDEKEFAAFATQDAGADAATAKGYYSIGSNRMVLYDLTAGAAGQPADDADVARLLEAVPWNIATVIHEATHQIAFNSGMHVRYADNPLWLVEGMAMYFETPDLSSKTGWKTAGATNDNRLEQFRDFVSSRRAADSLETLIVADGRFNDAAKMPDAYAEAWALSHFLIRTRKETYVDYLKMLAAKPRLVFDTPADRLAEFRAAFGENLNQLDAELLKYVKRLK
jgi:Protein of unknown function (DUF1570)